MSYIGSVQYVVLHDPSRILGDFAIRLKIDPTERARRGIWQILKFSHGYFFKDLKLEPMRLCLELHAHLRQFEQTGTLPAYVMHTHHLLRLGQPLTFCV